MLNSFKLDEEEIRNITTGIAIKGTSITMKFREIDSLIREAVSEVSSLAEVPNISYESLDGTIGEIEGLTNRIRAFGGIASEYYSEVDKEFYRSQDKVSNDLSNIVLNEIQVYDNLDLKSKVQSYGRYGAGSIETPMLKLEDILNESSVNNALKDSYEKNLEEIRQLKEFAELDIESLLEGYPEEDRQKLRDAQNQIKNKLKEMQADELISITYEKDLEKFLTSDKMNYPSRGEKALSTVLDFVPIVGNVKGLAEAITGQNLITGEKLSTGERVMSGIFSCLGLGAEGALVKNVGKAAVKEGFKGAVKFGGKEVLKDMSKNAAFYGGSVALSEVGVDQKTQLGFMAAVTIVGHGKTAKAGIENFSARAQGVSKGSFLDNLRVADKETYKKAMANLKDLTKDRRVVLSANSAGEIDKLINSNKNLRDLTKKIEKIEMTSAQKGSLAKIFAHGDTNIQKEVKELLAKEDKDGILKKIEGFENGAKGSRLEFKVNERISNNKYSLSGEEHYENLKALFGSENIEWLSINTKGITFERLIDNTVQKYRIKLLNEVGDEIKLGTKLNIVCEEGKSKLAKMATSGNHSYNPTILDDGEIFDENLFRDRFNNNYEDYYNNLLTDEYIDSLPKSYFTNKGLSIKDVKLELCKLRNAIERTKQIAKEKFGDKAINKYGNYSFQSDWNVENCAEIWSTRKAIMSGAKFDKIVLRCISMVDGSFATPCKNCKITFKGRRIIKDKYIK